MAESTPGGTPYSPDQAWYDGVGNRVEEVAAAVTPQAEPAPGDPAPIPNLHTNTEAVVAAVTPQPAPAPGKPAPAPNLYTETVRGAAAAEATEAEVAKVTGAVTGAAGDPTLYEVTKGAAADAAAVKTGVEALAGDGTTPGQVQTGFDKLGRDVGAVERQVGGVRRAIGPDPANPDNLFGQTKRTADAVAQLVAGNAAQATAAAANARAQADARDTPTGLGTHPDGAWGLTDPAALAAAYRARVQGGKGGVDIPKIVAEKAPGPGVLTGGDSQKTWRQSRVDWMRSFFRDYLTATASSTTRVVLGVTGVVASGVALADAYDVPNALAEGATQLAEPTQVPFFVGAANVLSHVAEFVEYSGVPAGVLGLGSIATLLALNLFKVKDRPRIR